MAIQDLHDRPQSIDNDHDFGRRAMIGLIGSDVLSDCSTGGS